MSSAAEIRTIALAEFAASGYAATSVSRIATLAKVSKSAVLYHYASKELLLQSAVEPALAALDGMVASLESGAFDRSARERFVIRFVDFLLAHRLEANLFINQAPSLRDVEVVDRANATIARLARFFDLNTGTVEERMRFGIALGGAAYMLCTEQNFRAENTPDAATRPALVVILSELLAPVSMRPTVV